MVKTIYSKKDKQRFYEKLLPFVSKTLKNLTTEYSYKEIADITGLHHTRVVEAANGRYLNEATLRSLLGGEVISLSEIKKNVEMSTKDQIYLDQLAATSHPALIRRLVRIIDKIGFDNTISRLDLLIKEK